MRTAICKGCGAEIFWIKMKTGKMMPTDTKEMKLIFYNNLTETGELVTMESCYMPHWATCSKAEDFKR